MRGTAYFAVHLTGAVSIGVADRTRETGLPRIPCLLLTAVLLGAPLQAVGQTCTSQNAGTWFAAARWSCTLPAGSRIPLATDNVVIGGNHVVTVGTANAVGASLTISAGNNNGGVTVNATRSLSIGGDVTISAAGLTGNNRAKTLTVAGTLNVGGSLAVDGQGANNRAAQLVISDAAAVVNVAGNITTTATVDSVINFTAAGTLNVQGDFASGLALTAGAGTVVYNGTGAQSVGAYTYNNLTINKSGGTATLSGVSPVAGNLSVTAGTLDLSVFTADRTAAGGTITVANGATLKVGGTNTFPASYATHTLGVTSTVEYAGTAQTVAAEGSPGYGHLTLSGSGTKTMPGAAQIVRGDFTMTGTASATALDALTVGGNMTLGSGTAFTAAAFTHLVAGNFTNDAATFTATGSTFQFNGTAAQAIGGTAASTTFNNLSITNTAAALTANHALTVTGSLTLASSSTLADGGNAVTVNGDIANAGSHTGAGRILLTGGSAAHALSGGGSYTNLELNDANGAILSANATVNGTLTFTSGNLATTSANILTIGAAGSIAGAGTSRHVTGNLAKAFSAAAAFTYALGDGINYTPIAVTFAAPVTGSLAAAVIASDHPNTTAATSGIDSAKSINRYWTVKNSTISGTYDAALTYINGNPVDRDSGATAASFVMRRGTGCSGSGGGRTCTPWGPLTVSGTPSNTQAVATGVSISSGDPEADIGVGEAVDTRFAREKEFIFTRELY